MNRERDLAAESAAAETKSREGGASAPSAFSSDRKFGTKQILPLFFIVFSLFWIFAGLSKFDFFNRLKGGTAAFLPVSCAAVMLVAGTVALIQSFKEMGEKPKLNMLCILFFAMCFGIVGLSYVIGLLPAMILYVFIWVKFVEKCGWISAVVATLACAAVGYGLFEFALGVPFSKGMLYSAFFR